MVLKYLEWNLHAMGGYGYQIPEFIAGHLRAADVFVLVEFRQSNGYGDKTEEGYLNINGLPDHAILKGMVET